MSAPKDWLVTFKCGAREVVVASTREEAKKIVLSLGYSEESILRIEESAVRLQ